jgi:hypothetical protein
MSLVTNVNIEPKFNEDTEPAKLNMYIVGRSATSHFFN